MPGRSIRKMGIHLGAANKKPKLPQKKKRSITNGTINPSVRKIPALITFLALSGLFSALYLVISRETVMGVPAVTRVKIIPNTERATWYKPIPSAPIVWERNILYKKPRAFSLIENTVTIATVLKKFRKCSPIKNLFTSILFARLLKYHIISKSIVYQFHIFVSNLL